MDKVQNPWVKSQRIKGEGSLNCIMSQFFSSQQPNDQQNYDAYLSSSRYQNRLSNSGQLQRQYKIVMKKMKKMYKATNNIGQLYNIFNIENRQKKLDQILQWIDKIQKKQKFPLKQINEQSKTNINPVDSNFFYLPLHSGTIFHQILKECTVKDKQKNIGEYKNIKAKKSLDQISQLLNLESEIQQQIL